jgi:hypothetical protein
VKIKTNKARNAAATTMAAMIMARRAFMRMPPFLPTGYAAAQQAASRGVYPGGGEAVKLNEERNDRGTAA